MSGMDNELAQLFVEEAKEHLCNIETDLVFLESAVELDSERVNRMFRAVHSIKGAAGCLGFERILELSHALECIFSLMRDRELEINPDIVTSLLQGFDLLTELVNSGFASNERDISEQVVILNAIIPPKPPQASVLEENRLGNLLVQEGLVTEQDIAAALSQQKRIGEILVEQAKVKPDQIEEALAKQQAVTRSSIRVDTQKLDELLNLVGEVVISQAHVLQLSHQLDGIAANDLKTILARLERNTRSLQGKIMGIRMVPIGPMLSQYNRIVRDLSLSLKKPIKLIIQGEDTEVDKTIIEQLADPLKHMLRNAIDHGVESPEERSMVGKPEQGTIILGAYHEGDAIVIEVSDDGKGLDRDKILAKARHKGLVGEDSLSDDQVFGLIFQPGFSTAEQVSDLSGRGVGMDVVKRNIESLRGRIEIESEKGLGTTFRLRLPLTLAIVDGLLVKIAGNSFILPLAQVLECLELQPVMQSGRQVISIRETLIPFVRLREFFQFEGLRPSHEQVVIISLGGERIGLVVDEVVGDLQAVIKPLGKICWDSDSFSGASIMGDGEIALILDIPNVLRKAQTEESLLLH